MQLAEQDIDIREQPPISLAFLGDGVLELLVRSRLVRRTRLQPNELHRTAVKFVSAKGQSAALAVIEPMLTERELNVVRRGRNASKAAVAKHATAAEYRASTAFEALIGWLYLSGDTKRIDELFDAAWDAVFAPEPEKGT
mgnify:FL=1